MSRRNEARHIEWYKTCKCEWRLDTNVCNNKQLWNNDTCKCFWNPSTCECELDKSCDVGGL